jgi:hypothetical protein
MRVLFLQLDAGTPCSRTMSTRRHSKTMSGPWSTARPLPIALLVLAGAAATPLGGSLVREIDFVSLNQRAGTLFHGRCIERKEVPDARPFGYTEYTFEIIEGVKGCRDAAGKPTETMTVRHAGTRSGHVRPDGLEVPPLRLGLPEYEVGEEVVLFLTRESKLGLCAPVGLSQGKFSVIRAKGRVLVRNSQANRCLFDTLEASPPRGLSKVETRTLREAGEALNLRDLLDACRKLSDA